jgi:hypothetical protein
MEIDSKLEGLKQTAKDCVASFAWYPKTGIENEWNRESGKAWLVQRMKKRRN